MSDENALTIVDTTVWVDYLKDQSTPQTSWLESNLTIHDIALTDLIFCEVLQGIRDEEMFQRVRRELLIFGVHSSSGVAFAGAAAENYRTLRKRGITVRTTVDCLIATYCLLSGYRLLHNDRDFDSFEEHLGLQVVHPERPLPNQPII